MYALKGIKIFVPYSACKFPIALIYCLSALGFATSTSTFVRIFFVCFGCRDSEKTGPRTQDAEVGIRNSGQGPLRRHANPSQVSIRAYERSQSAIHSTCWLSTFSADPWDPCRHCSGVFALSFERKMLINNACVFVYFVCLRVNVLSMAPPPPMPSLPCLLLGQGNNAIDFATPTTMGLVRYVNVAVNMQSRDCTGLTYLNGVLPDRPVRLPKQSNPWVLPAKINIW